MKPEKITVRAIFFVFALLIISCSLNPKVFATFYGEVKTGQYNVPDDRYGYSVFVPEEYNSDTQWPLVIALHNEGERGEDHVQSWIETARKRKLIVVAPTFQLPQGGVPYEHDERILKLKRIIEEQYNIESNRILVVGAGSGGEYALYLGLRYPKEFSSIASIGNPVQIIFRNILGLSYASANQLPILILVANKNEIESSKESVDILDQFRSKGYQIEVVEKQEVGQAAYSYILDWSDEVSAKRRESQGSSSVGQKIYEKIDQLFQNR